MLHNFSSSETHSLACRTPYVIMATGIREWKPLVGIMGIVALLAAAGTGGVMARSPPPANSNRDCTNPIVSLSPCLGYITGVRGSSKNGAKGPAEDCCIALATVAVTGVACLCELLTTNNPLGFPINRTLVISLPQACNIYTSPPLYQCSGANVLVPPPAVSPSGSDERTVSPPPTGQSMTPPAGSTPAPSTRGPPISSPPVSSTTGTPPPSGFRVAPSVHAPSVPSTDSGPVQSTPSNFIPTNTSDVANIPPSAGANTHFGNGAGALFTACVITMFSLGLVQWTILC